MALAALPGPALAQSVEPSTPAVDAPAAPTEPGPPTDTPAAQSVVVAPSLRSRAQPAYPQAADGKPARVTLNVLVDSQGAPQEVQAVEVDRADPTAAAPFLEAADRFVRELRFEPASREGMAVPAWIRFEVLFAPSLPAAQPAMVPSHHHHANDVTHSHAPAATKTDVPELTATASVSRPFDSASTVQLDGARLRLAPYRGADDLLNAAPGFYVVKHGGGGKAAQYFLRGFDADHGTDVAFFVDGVPENHVSHGHGQGFTNLNWVIPETVDQVRVRKGPYFSDVGDFATAGSVDMRLREGAPPSFVSLQGGSFGTLRGVTVLSPELDVLQPMLAAEVVHSDGFFDIEEDLLRVNGLVRTRSELGSSAVLTGTLTTHVSEWRAPGQIPLREVRAGELSRYGSLDTHEGGQSARHSLTLRLSSQGRTSESHDADRSGYDLLVYAVRSQLALYSDFTFFSRDPVAGDMIRQGDERTMLGFDGRYTLRQEVGRFDFGTLFGLQLRYDAIDNSLADAPARQVTLTRVDASIDQSAVGLFLEQRASYDHYLRLTLGVRGDVMSFAVRDRVQSDGSDGSGEALDGRVSPKAGLVVTPLAQPEWLALFANFGYGFHSNDARGIVPGGGTQVTPMTPALGYELGARTRLFDRLSVTGVAFLLDLDSELVWVGDEGTTEPSGRTRRMGLEAEVELEVLRWLDLVFDATLVEAHLRDAPDAADSIPLAPRVLLQSAVIVTHQATGLAGRLGVTHVGDRPATEDDFLTAEGFTRLDAAIRYDHERFALALSASNLLHTSWRQAQFATTSRLEDEADASACPAGTRPVSDSGTFAGCEDLHFMAGNPIDVQATATLKF